MDSRRRELTTGLGFISPWLVGFAALTAYPFAASFYWSFCRYDLLSPPEFIGGANYARLAHELVTTQRFGLALANTAYYALLSVPLSIALGILLAIMLSWKVRGQAVFRTLLFLPAVVPTVAAAVLWMWLLDPQDGLVNALLAQLGVPAQGWFNSPSSLFWPGSWSPDWGEHGHLAGSKDGLILMSLWGVGNFMIIYLAALGDIPRSLYEAAELDGAHALRRFWNVTLPMLSPIIFFNLIMGLIHAVQAFTPVYLVSEGQGSPAGSTLVLSLHLFLAAFKELDMGYASAMAWLLFVIVALATLFLFRSSRHWVHYGG